MQKNVDSKKHPVLINLMQKLDEIKNEPLSLFIVNAGKMNHGKSSVFNSLLDKDVFASADIRTTTKVAEAEFQPGTFLLDTPGLAAELGDDEESFAAYRKANSIAFVHTLRVGELHKDEIESINKIKRLFPEEAYFWQHFCLILTFRESVDDHDTAEIEKKILADIKNHCQGENFPVFKVSNSRYKNGKEKAKQGLIKASGINELREYFLQQIDTWKQDAADLKAKRIKENIVSCQSALEAEKKHLSNVLAKNEKKVEAKKHKLTRLIAEYFEDLERDSQSLKEKDNTITMIKKTITDLENKHDRDRDNY